MADTAKPKSYFSLIMIGAVLAFLALLLLYLWLPSDKENAKTIATQPIFSSAIEPLPEKTITTIAVPAVQKITPEASASTPATTPQPVATVSQILASPIPLLVPSLNNSDAYTREKLHAVFEQKRINQWLPQTDLIRRFATFVDSLSRGNLVRGQLEYIPLKGKFSAIETTPGHYRIDPQSYHRYDAISRFFSRLNTKNAIQLYRQTNSIITQAHQELGHPAVNFDQVFIQAIDEILATPEIEADISLIRPSVMYRFEDKKLESLSKVQKQLIRMGPRNIRTIKAKLKEIRTALR